MSTPLTEQAREMADKLEDMIVAMHATSPLVTMPPISASLPAQAAAILRRLADEIDGPAPSLPHRSWE